jgi:hypothetical protein
MTCEYCGATPAPYRITEENGEQIFLCADCREDVEYCTRGGKPESEEEVEVEGDLWGRLIDSWLSRPQPAHGNAVAAPADPETTQCGITEPHAPGAHPPAINPDQEDEEEPNGEGAG